MSTPIVEITSQNVFLNTSVAASDLFIASDSDAAIVSYFFQDFGLSPSSGHFAFDGNAIPDNEFFEIDADDLGLLSYVAGSVPGSEMIRIMAKDADGFVSSPLTIGNVYSVRANTTAPFARANSFSVVGNETFAGTDIAWGFDPDGYPIQSFTIRDRSVDGGYFEVDGVAQTQGAFFTLAADDLDKLRYVATGPLSSEQFDVMAFDGAQSSINHVGVATRIANANPPVIQYASFVIDSDQLFSMVNTNPIVDADENTIKKYMFNNTSVDPLAGELIFNGVVQDRQTYFEVDAAEIESVFLDARGLEFAVPQRIEIMAFDGLNWSEAGLLDITTQIKPVFKPNVVFEIAEEYDFVAFSRLFDKLDPGLDYVSYQVFDPDTDPLGGSFAVQGIPVDGGTVQEYSALDFVTRLRFRTGTGRGVDTVYVRANNSQKWSRWESLDILTEPEIENALDSGPDWTNYIPPQGEDGPRVITYSFMEEVPSYGGAEIGEEEDMEHFTPFTNEQRANARAAFRHLETIANVLMLEVGDSGAGGIIRMGEFGDAEAEDVAAFAYTPSSSPLGGDMWFNRIIMGGEIALTPGTFGYETFLHELGHAMGLKHPFEGGSTLPAETDSTDFTVMSYTAGANGFATTYQLYDIYSLQDFYGPNMSHSTGNDVYSISRTWGGSQVIFDAIWDASGNDTLSAWGSAAPAVVDLRSGQASTIGTNVDNVQIAFAATIEGGIGSNFGDTLYGNAVNNYLDGRAGDDMLKGGAGNDRVFSGPGSDTIEFGVADGIDVLDERSEGGLDTLKITPFAGLDTLEEDFRFFMAANGTDLVVDLTLDNGDSQGLVIIKNQQMAMNQIETLDLNGVRIDLVNLAFQVTPTTHRFQVLETSNSQGFLVAPV